MVSVVETTSKLLAWLNRNPWLALALMTGLLLMPTWWLPSVSRAFDSLFPGQAAELDATLTALDESFQRYWAACEEGEDLTESNDHLPTDEELAPEQLQESGSEESEQFVEDAEVDPLLGEVPSEFNDSLVITGWPASGCGSPGLREIVVTLDVDISGSDSGGASIRVASWGSGNLVSKGQRIQITYGAP